MFFLKLRTSASAIRIPSLNKIQPDPFHLVAVRALSFDQPSDRVQTLQFMARKSRVFHFVEKNKGRQMREMHEMRAIFQEIDW